MTNVSGERSARTDTTRACAATAAMASRCRSMRLSVAKRSRIRSASQRCGRLRAVAKIPINRSAAYALDQHVQCIELRLAVRLLVLRHLGRVTVEGFRPTDRRVTGRASTWFIALRTRAPGGHYLRLNRVFTLIEALRNFTSKLGHAYHYWSSATVSRTPVLFSKHSSRVPCWTIGFGLRKRRRRELFRIDSGGLLCLR